jgi:hypothetical protein
VARRAVARKELGALLDLLGREGLRPVLRYGARADKREAEAEYGVTSGWQKSIR